MRLMSKIKSFEEGPETLKSFNLIFSECPILGFDETELVEIGECCSPETTRIVTIDGTSFRHNFVPVLSDQLLKEGDENE